MSFNYLEHIIMELKKLNQLISTIKAGATRQRDQIQTALIECAVYAAFDRNTDPAIRLMDAIGKGVNRRAVGKWLSLNAPIVFKDEKPAISNRRQDEIATQQSVEQFRAELANVAPWYDTDGTNKAVNAWDSLAEMRKIEKFLGDELKKANENDPVFAAYLEKVTTTAFAMFIRAREAAEYTEVEEVIEHEIVEA